MHFAQRHHLTPNILLVLLVVTLSLAAGIYGRITRDPYLTRGTSDVAVVTPTNAFDSKTNANVAAPTSIYHGIEYSVMYPQNWTLVQSRDRSLSVAPSGTTFYFEGSIDYPITISTTPKSADQYVASLPSGNKSKVTINGFEGYKAKPDCPTCGSSTFYIFTLKDRASAVVINYTGDTLEQTRGTSISHDVLKEAFEQIANSIHLEL